MTKKNIITLAVSFLAVAAVYYYMYRDYFRKPHIQLSHTFRETPYTRRRTPAGEEPAKAVIFGLNGQYRLTSIKVVSVPELQTNKYPHPVWELTSDSNSIPTKVFVYGIPIRGMHPKVKGAKADELDPNIPYRLFVAAGNLKGEHDFRITPEGQPAQ